MDNRCAVDHRLTACCAAGRLPTFFIKNFNGAATWAPHLGASWGLAPCIFWLFSRRARGSEGRERWAGLSQGTG